MRRDDINRCTVKTNNSEQKTIDPGNENEVVLNSATF